MDDRLSRVREYIDKKGRITLHDLEEAFPDVSSMTLRRDMDKLEQLNAILRIPGGALSVNTVLRAKEKDFSERATDNPTEKIEIADKAVNILDPKSCVFIDGGSTTTYFARALPDDDYYVLTNALVIAETVMRKEKPKVMLLGGDLRRNNSITVGNTCLEIMDRINIQNAVITSTGFIAETGSFTCGMQSEADVKRKAIDKADKVIMLLDSSKVDKKTPYTFATIKDIDILVVDNAFPEDIKTKIIEMGIKVY